MKTEVAQGNITLSSVEDAIELDMTPAICIVQADYDGRNPQLSKAVVNLGLTQGSKPLKFTVTHVASSHEELDYEILGGEEESQLVHFTSIPSDSLDGHITLLLKFKSEQTKLVTIPYSVVREGQSYAWLKEWDTNKTEIGGQYLITPQIFAGIKEANGNLTGVYLGPVVGGAGVYGTHNGSTIFSIDHEGGRIGGWVINETGIQSADKGMSILSSGSITSQIEGISMWALKSDGSAQFAQGNVYFSANGDAYLEGEIVALKGSIGGWNIETSTLSSNHVMIDSLSHYIGISPQAMTNSDRSNPLYVHHDTVKTHGGVCMLYTSSSSYGFEGYLPARTINGETVEQRTFSLGANNHIASWNFDGDSIWIGTKINEALAFAENVGDITIGSCGLRGKGWYIDTNGQTQLAGGLASFSHNGGSIAGWNLANGKMYSNKVTLVSSGERDGLYISSLPTISTSLDNLIDDIHTSGGVYVNNVDGQAQLVGVDSEGDILFRLVSSPKGSMIAGWNFDSDALYLGKKVTEGYAESAGDITLSTSGLRGYTWAINPDGSGSLANGNVMWNPDGSGSVAGGAIMWDVNGYLNIANGGIVYDPETGVMLLSGVTVTWGNIDETPEWISDCENTKTQIGEKYMISPSVFSGTKDSNGKLTGIMSGDNVLINGAQRTGIFALVDDEVVFEIDPISKKYKFKGTIEADDGRFSGTIYSPFSVVEPIKNEGEQTGEAIYIDFSTGFNIDIRKVEGASSGNWNTIYLPNAAEYIGVNCSIYNGIGAYTRSYHCPTIRVAGDTQFRNLPSPNSSATMKPHALAITVAPGKMVNLRAVGSYDADDELIGVYWYVVNASDCEVYEYAEEV